MVSYIILKYGGMVGSPIKEKVNEERIDNVLLLCVESQGGNGKAWRGVSHAYWVDVSAERSLP